MIQGTKGQGYELIEIAPSGWIGLSEQGGDSGANGEGPSVIVSIHVTRGVHARFGGSGASPAYRPTFHALARY